MNTDKKQALSVHLKAIRRMLIVSVASVAVLFVLFFYLLCGPLVDFVLAPVRARGIEVITTSVSEALMMQFKVCLIAAVIAGMPVIIWQVWVFVAPALYPQEKRLFAALFFVALLLFAGGRGILLLPGISHGNRPVLVGGGRCGLHAMVGEGILQLRAVFRAALRADV